MHKRLNIDVETWQACKNGDKNAYASIYRMFYSRLYVYGCRFTKDENMVEDCIQEIFTNFWINRKKMGAVNCFQSYLFVSFRNKLTRNIQLQHTSLTKELPDNDYDFKLELSADHMMIDTEKIFEQKILLNDALANLTERQKEIIFLKFYENLSYDEIATTLGTSVKATYKLFSRAILVLRQTYQKKLTSLSLSILFLFISMYDFLCSF